MIYPRNIFILSIRGVFGTIACPVGTHLLGPICMQVNLPYRKMTELGPKSAIFRIFTTLVTLSPVHSAHNLRFIFDSNLTFSEHISTVSNSCFYHIRDLTHIRNTLDHCRKRRPSAIALQENSYIVNIGRRLDNADLL
jgi:hypothetical protein